ncbi:rab-type small GTP-binding protein [Suillus discolor]|uniref:Rab-type small GTP-binding protein n=1 Tax=Suillus discolor TaxID=1912936 RepID=A0A9P7F6K0_9AGAM|nr:rab-type small GTP-binding protein [Suillus discolor]KAG2107622.1 rab-type small GTP-binding protein [Suillus discolor]
MPLPHYDFLIKSCLLLHFCDNEINFKVRTIELDGKRIKVQIWDTASQERFRTITTMCYHVATGILLVYDVTDERSYNSIRTWHAKIKQRASEDVNVILIGNKSDWTDKRVVPDIQGRALADELGMKFMETSAKAKEGVEEVFFTLTRDCKTRLMDLQADSAVLVGGAPNAGGSVKINQPVTSASIGSCL